MGLIVGALQTGNMGGKGREGEKSPPFHALTNLLL